MESSSHYTAWESELTQVEYQSPLQRMIETAQKCDILGMTDAESWIYQQSSPSFYFSRDWKSTALCFPLTGFWALRHKQLATRRERRVAKRGRIWLLLPFVPFPCFEALLCSQESLGASQRHQPE